ncbi:MAG: HEAT repeat domain-containing protein, partial [Phycisphaerae bacterium]|nr:HEAT repeat domain-containing protein [Phycisphaerae bacterium]
SKMGTKGVKILADLIEGRDVPKKLSEDKRMLLCLRKFSMAALADRRGDPAVEKHVASAVKSNVLDVQVWALRAMQKLGLKGRKAVYSTNLRSDAEWLRMTAAVCMGREKEPDPRALPVLVYIVDNHSSAAIGNEAARLLARFPAAEVAREVAELAEELADAPLERFKTLEIISLHVEPAAMKSVNPNALLAVVQDEGKSAYHGKALRILGNMKATSAAADLMALYAKAAKAGADVKKRGLYIRALGAMGAEKAIPMLADLLKGKEEWIRDEAAYALGRIGPKAIPALEQLLGDHTSLSHNVPDSFASACRAAAKKGGHWADVGHARHLPTGLHVSRYAARAIGFMGAAGGKRASATLLRCANGSGTPKGTRFEAARSLSLIGDKASMRKIKPHLSVWMQAYLADMAELGTLMAVMDLQPTRKAGAGWNRPFRAIGQNSRIAGFTKDPLVTWNLSNVLDQGEAANMTDGRTDWVGGVFKNQA